VDVIAESPAPADATGADTGFDAAEAPGDAIDAADAIAADATVDHDVAPPPDLTPVDVPTAPPDAAPDAPVMVVHAPVAGSGRCAEDAGVPLRTGASATAFACTAVGAPSAPTTGDWPATTGLPGPVAFVRPEFMGTSDGTIDRPFRSIADALGAVPRAATIALSRGTHLVASTLTLEGDRLIVGLGGAGGSVIEIARGQSGLTCASGTLTMRDLSVTYGAGDPSLRDVAVLVGAAGTLATSRVTLSAAWTAVRVRGGRASLTATSVLRTRSTGVIADSGARLTLNDFLIRGSGDVGLLVDASSLVADTGAVVESAHQGIAFVNDAPATGGRDNCASGTAPGRWSCLNRVVVADNGVAALALYGRNAVEGRRSSFSRTRRVSIPDGDGGLSEENGDGVLVTGNAELALDPDILDDARMGFGTEIAENARVGVLAQGDGARGTLRGARIALNGASGVFVAGQANLREVGYSRIDGNRLGGVVVVPLSSVASIQCNGIADTQMGSVMTTTGPLTAGDALSLNNTDAPPEVRANRIDRSDRFAVVASNLAGRLTDNRGGDNLYGLGLYGATTSVQSGNDLRPLLPAPTTNPGIVGAAPR